MEYISAKEAAERWGIQVRGVQELARQGAYKARSNLNARG